MRAAALLLLATGCRDLLAIEDAIPAELSYREVGTGGVVAGSFEGGLPFELHFPDGDGFHFPNALLIDGADVMGHDPGQSCTEEDEVGIRISPTPRISASGEAPRVTNLLTPVMRGPAVVQVKLDWSTRLACNSDRNPGGASTFTVFPDGRIARYDTITDPSSSAISASQCTCNGAGAGFTIATFWTLAREAFSTLKHAGLPDDLLPLPAVGEVTGDNTGWSCVANGTREVTLVRSDNVGTRIRGHDQLIGFGFELLVNATMPGAFSLGHGSVLFIGRSTVCADAEARANEYFDPSALTVDGAAVKPSRRDGIYGGDTGDGAVTPGIELANDRAELTGPVRGPYAVWLRFPRSVSSVRAVRAGATGSWYVPQRVDDRSWIVWFEEPLQAGQTITVEPG